MLKSTKILFPSSSIYHAALYSSELAQMRIQQAFSVLGLDETASVEELKDRFSQLAKQYHPDTGGEKANPDKFFHIQSSFKMALKSKYDDVEAFEEEEEATTVEHDIKHTAPQHRQYLEYGGIGIGTPSTRQRQYQQYRVFKAVENAAEFVLDKALQQDGSQRALQLHKERQYFSKKHKLTGMIDRVVEELILSSMNSGDFSNLKGAGKPLKFDYTNPYIDEAEKRVNDIMKNNGFAPPWITQDAEIREDIAFLRKRLRDEYCRFRLVQASNFINIKAQTNPLNRWEKFKEESIQEVGKVNLLIRDYNLTCPISGRQFVGIMYEKELKAAIDFVDGEESEKLKKEINEKLKKEDAYRKTNNYQTSFWGFLKDSFRPNIA